MKAAIFMMLALATAGLCQDGAKRLSQEEVLGAVVNKVEPAYPPLARQLNISGAVRLEAVVNEQGAVERVNIVSGNPILTKAGSEALAKWKFKPAVADGKPVKAIAPVSFRFNM